MRFTVLDYGQKIPAGTTQRAFLITDNWNDWFEFRTMYSLVILDDDGERTDIGSVKIGQFGMKSDQKQPNLPESFTQLSDDFFSLGQDDSYYTNLNQLGSGIRESVLRGLRDFALDEKLFERALAEKVTGTSLLRSVSHSTVLGQYSRLARGMSRLSPFNFSYTLRKSRTSQNEPPTLSFNIVPDSMPPTNIHVLIGRNGVGKTSLLNNMTRCLVVKDSDMKESGSFQASETGRHRSNMFANLVSVSFSAFDDFEPLSISRDRPQGIQYHYVGLKKIGASQEGKALSPKSIDSLSRDFSSSMKVCSKGARLDRWRLALKALETDPIFGEANVSGLANNLTEGDEQSSSARTLFKKLSSGHKIVLLTITRLVETVEERTLVLLDEPEAHLHPPLLSAFIRALSDLLINRNGVAIIATHSPVVLQEVPSKCVWKIQRNGESVRVLRPGIETFGENVGVLTREAFGLEVTKAGFHKLLRDAIGEEDDYSAVLEKFQSELGAEASAIVRAMIANRDNTTAGE